MKRKQRTLAGQLGRCLRFITFVILAVAVTWHLQPDWFRWLPTDGNNSNSPQRTHLRNPQELIVKIDARLTIERKRLKAIEESLKQIQNLRNSLQNQVDSMQNDLADRRLELEKYAELVNDDEGIVLENNEYVSATSVRNRAIERKKQFSEIQRQLDHQLKMVIKVDRSLKISESQLGTRKHEVDELQLLRDGLSEKLTMLSRMKSPTNDDQYADSSLASLRTAVESTQDIIDIRLEMLEEDTELEHSLGVR
tara:strand:+ start:10172 stop:10927 length:756 start_codon:yes stop_codon:yes gene_type:complete